MKCWLRIIRIRPIAAVLRRQNHRPQRAVIIGGRSGWCCERRKSFPASWFAREVLTSYAPHCPHTGGQTRPFQWHSKSWLSAPTSSTVRLWPFVRVTMKTFTANCETAPRRWKTKWQSSMICDLWAAVDEVQWNSLWLIIIQCESLSLINLSSALALRSVGNLDMPRIFNEVVLDNYFKRKFYIESFQL